jgi:hypothetical protein
MIKTSQSFANEQTFNLYVKYLAFKKHFTTDQYDYQKYRGKVRASFDKFRTRNDVFFFHKLWQKDEPENYLLANMIVNPNSWIREIVEETGEARYLEWKKKIESLSYTFKSDLRKLDDNYQANFATPDGQHPLVMRLYLQKQITLETFTLLTNMSNIFPYWDTNLVDKIVARDIIRLSKKYRPFLEIDEKKFKDIVRNHFF